MRIAIGSTNPVKCNATRAVLKPLYPDAEFLTVDVRSGVAAQPWGDKETRTGAVNRARAGLRQTDAELSIGLEGGVQDSEYGLMTTAWCAMVDSTGRLGIGGNACVLLPEPVAALLRAGYDLGMAMDQLTHRTNTRQQNGAIGILTNDMETRQSAYQVIIRFALASFQNPDLYPSPTAS